MKRNRYGESIEGVEEKIKWMDQAIEEMMKEEKKKKRSIKMLYCMVKTSKWLWESGNEKKSVSYLENILRLFSLKEENKFLLKMRIEEICYLVLHYLSLVTLSHFPSFPFLSFFHQSKDKVDKKIFLLPFHLLSQKKILQEKSHLLLQAAQKKLLLLSSTLSSPFSSSSSSTSTPSFSPHSPLFPLYLNHLALFYCCHSFRRAFLLSQQFLSYFDSSSPSSSSERDVQCSERGERRGGWKEEMILHLFQYMMIVKEEKSFSEKEIEESKQICFSPKKKFNQHFFFIYNVLVIEILSNKPKHALLFLSQKLFSLFNPFSSPPPSLLQLSTTLPLSQTSPHPLAPSLSLFFQNISHSFLFLLQDKFFLSPSNTTFSPSTNSSPLRKEEPISFIQDDFEEMRDQQIKQKQIKQKEIKEKEKHEKQIKEKEIKEEKIKEVKIKEVKMENEEEKMFGWLCFLFFQIWRGKKEKEIFSLFEKVISLFKHLSPSLLYSPFSSSPLPNREESTLKKKMRIKSNEKEDFENWIWNDYFHFYFSSFSRSPFPNSSDRFTSLHTSLPASSPSLQIDQNEEETKSGLEKALLIIENFLRRRKSIENEKEENEEEEERENDLKEVCKMIEKKEGRECGEWRCAIKRAGRIEEEFSFLFAEKESGEQRFSILSNLEKTYHLIPPTQWKAIWKKEISLFFPFNKKSIHHYFRHLLFQLGNPLKALKFINLSFKFNPSSSSLLLSKLIFLLLFSKENEKRIQVLINHHLLLFPFKKKLWIISNLLNIFFYKSTKTAKLKSNNSLNSALQLIFKQTEQKSQAHGISWN